MSKNTIYTIGHGNRKQEDLLDFLTKYKIQYVIDVRSQPYSKYSPAFNQNDIKYFLETHGLNYVFMGDSIGGRPNDPTCYDKEGKVDYEVLKDKEFFLNGIDRLITASEKEINVILLCSESKPVECHRSKLIGRVLFKKNIILQHIDENGNLKDQVTIINELNKGRSDIDLFGNSINTTSRKSYHTDNED